MNKPFFSVIVPAHNAAGRIRKLLDSIKMQTFDDYEVIIVCDDCQDNTSDIAAEYLEQELTQGIVMEVRSITAEKQGTLAWNMCAASGCCSLMMTTGGEKTQRLR